MIWACHIRGCEISGGFFSTFVSVCSVGFLLLESIASEFTLPNQIFAEARMLHVLLSLWGFDPAES
ncbi:unnamed protein product [Arabis nemorensis]|uniref:Uncharacterized protein n=1 Tax=Arabis nemorensis TaxID=586526 RepID=A0A565AYS5_9BRAS|nr:unnamed protein product [Arabis nemorensis]